MKPSRSNIFTTVQTEGALLPADILQKLISHDPDIEGLSPESYHLDKQQKINEEITRSWNKCIVQWRRFQSEIEKLPSTDVGTSLTRERWLMPLFQELGYGRLLAMGATEIEGKTYTLSHYWNHSPIHLLSFRVSLDKRTPGVAGAAQRSPHSMVQEFLNRSDDHLWAFVSNGLRLRILRDNISLSRQAYVEFDLEAMMNGDVYSDFVLLWLLCHSSRVEADAPEQCWLEQWSKLVLVQGVRILDELRVGVEKAISSIGTGLISHPANGALRTLLSSGKLSKKDYYHQLLRLIYRCIFLFVAEDRGFLLKPDATQEQKLLFYQYYSLSRLRDIATHRQHSKHSDLWEGVKLLFTKLHSEGIETLGLPALGSSLWDPSTTPVIEYASLSNLHLIAAIRSLTSTVDNGLRRSINYKNMGSEELGSIYEALLEYHPVLNLTEGTFKLETLPGHERKLTASYYTPSSLVECLLDSALDPVIHEAIKKPDPEKAILSLKVCDPACGSGHFLVAAAHRMARWLAFIRTGDEEPAPHETQHALRDVISQCIYGVDLNPMAVELAKVSLWMESVEPGKALSFLDHHIRVGNSLIGATPLLLSKGIPDEAFSPISGDDKAVCSQYKKLNKEAHKGIMPLFQMESSGEWQLLQTNQKEMNTLDAMDVDSAADYMAKEKAYREHRQSDAYKRSRQLADFWCSSFFFEKNNEIGCPPVTEQYFKYAQSGGLYHTNLPAAMRDHALLLCSSKMYNVFHWQLEFPDVFSLPKLGESPQNPTTGWNGGFDIVLGNPPWERIKIAEKEWFSEHRPDIATAANSSARKKMIEQLKTEDPALFQAYQLDQRKAEGESHFIRNTGHYPLCGRGDVNTYAIFAELNRQLINAEGRAGFIVPSGIATDDTTKYYFEDIIENKSLISFFEFENNGFFLGAGQGHMVRFSLTTLGGCNIKTDKADFIFQAKAITDLNEVKSHFCLSSSDIALVNPNTRTCPIFRSKADAEISKFVYFRVPILIRDARDGRLEENPWKVEFSTMFHMSNDSHLFRTRIELESDGWMLHGNVFVKGAQKYLPLYESKMINLYSHRFSDFSDSLNGERAHILPEVSSDRLKESHYSVLPFYWVPCEEVHGGSHLKACDWSIGFRNVTDSRASARSIILSVIPESGVGNSLPLILSRSEIKWHSAFLVACLSSFIVDYCARFKIGGLNLNFFIMKQLPVLPHSFYMQESSLIGGNQAISEWIKPRILELIYTSWDLSSFAMDCGYSGPPFRWDENRRFLLRAELDALYFHLYLGTVEDWSRIGTPELLADFPSPRDAVGHIMDTFPIVKRKDEAKYGEYRTKRVILEIYDEMAEAQLAGKEYQTRLDPPPADPRVAHGGKVL